MNQLVVDLVSETGRCISSVTEDTRETQVPLKSLVVVQPLVLLIRLLSVTAGTQYSREQF